MQEFYDLFSNIYDFWVYEFEKLRIIMITYQLMFLVIRINFILNNNFLTFAVLDIQVNTSSARFLNRTYIFFAFHPCVDSSFKVNAVTFDKIDEFIQKQSPLVMCAIRIEQVCDKCGMKSDFVARDAKYLENVEIRTILLNFFLVIIGYFPDFSQ